jgi:hypothetical protein
MGTMAGTLNSIVVRKNSGYSHSSFHILMLRFSRNDFGRFVIGFVRVHQSIRGL